MANCLVTAKSTGGELHPVVRLIFEDCHQGESWERQDRNF